MKVNLKRPKFDLSAQIRSDKALYLLCFLLPVGIMFLAYALFGVYPFGKGSVLVLDLNAQYVYYYEAFRDAVFSGDLSFYSWSRNLSGSTFGIFAYYLASPFMFIVCLFPRTKMTQAVECIQLLKIGFSSLTFAYFLIKTHLYSGGKRPRRLTAVVFCLMYSLMSYMVVQLMDPMWLDGLIYLPLICLGVQRLVNEGKILPMAVPLALMFMAHFYIGYMIGFFTFCYFLYCCFGQENRIFPRKPILTAVKFGCAAVCAVFAAAWVIIPVYNSLKLGKLDFSEPDWSVASQFDYVTLLTKLFPMSYDTVYPEGLPMIYCGTAAVLLVPLFFMNKKITIKRKVSSGLLLFVMTVFMYIKPVDIVWHGFQVPNWLPFRYSFTVSFLILVMAQEAFEKLDGITPKEIGGAFFGAAAFLMFCEHEGFEHFQTFRIASEEGTDSRHAVIGGIWFSAIALAVYFLLIYLNRKYKTSRILCVITCAAVGVEMLANSMDTLQKIDDDVLYSKQDSYEPYMSDTRDAVKHINNFEQEPFFRMESTYHRSVNDPIGTGYYGISHSSSVMIAPALKLLKQLGYAYGGHYTKYDGSTYITDSVLDIKYIMQYQKDQKDDDKIQYVDKRIKLPEDYKLATHIKESSALYKFYKNPYAMGLGVVCSENINTIELSDSDPFANQNLLYSALANDVQVTDYFHRLEPVESDRLNVSSAKLTDGEHIKFYPTDTSSEAHIDYLIEMDRDSDLYMYFPTKYERSCNVWVLDEEEYINGDGSMDFAGQFFEGDNYSILDLGHFLENERVRVRVTLDNEENEAYWSDELFYSFDHDSFVQTAEGLRQQSLQITKFENANVEGCCTAEADGEYLFTTIPDEPGWTVTVNGKQVKTKKAVGALITIPLEKGKNEIVMKFSPDYFKGSLIISLAGILIMAMLFVFEYKDGRIIHLLAQRSIAAEKRLAEKSE